MAFFSKILEKLGIGSTADAPIPLRHLPARPRARVRFRPHRRSGRSLSSMSSHNWSSARQLTRRS
jgi:hypothetical protein